MIKLKNILKELTDTSFKGSEVIGAANWGNKSKKKK